MACEVEGISSLIANQVAERLGFESPTGFQNIVDEVIDGVTVAYCQGGRTPVDAIADLALAGYPDLARRARERLVETDMGIGRYP